MEAPKEAEAAPPDDFGEHLQSAVDKNRPVLAGAASSPAAKAWLEPRLATPEGTQQVYGLLETLVAGPKFLAKLTAAREKQSSTATEFHGREVLEPGWWEPPGPPASSGPEIDSTEVDGYEQVRTEDAGPPEEPLDSYVMVEKDDVLDAIGTFVAAYLAELPEAQNLQPKELQVAIKHAFKELRKSRVRQLWGWGRAIYRTIAFSYGAFSVYENPWLVRACLAAIWTAARMMFGLLI